MLLKYRKLVLTKDYDGKKTMIYNGKKYNELSENDFNNILEKVKFGNAFSLPDRMIQDFISDGSINPTFKSVKTFNNNDLENIIKPFKRQRGMKRNVKARTLKIKRSKGNKQNKQNKQKRKKGKQSKKNRKTIKEK